MKLIKNKSGFTLVELLAVIVILAIILAITVPIISDIFDSSTRAAFANDAKMVIKAIDYKKISDENFDATIVTESNIKNLLGISNNNYELLQVSVPSGKTYVLIAGKNKWVGLKACGTYQNMQVVDIDDLEECVIATYADYDVIEGVNRPKLAENMTAIKWDDTTSDWVKVNDPDNDTSWYNYAHQEWANAVTGDCNTPGDYDTCSMWVWIPRYAYQIEDCYHLGRSQCNTDTGKDAGKINIKFLIDDTNTTIGNTPIYEDNETNTHYVLHPAFTFGDKELTGIWVAKFEASGSTDSLSFKPGLIALQEITVGNMFTASRNMEKNTAYGWTPIPSEATLGSDGIFSTESGGSPSYNKIDTHTMKNIEWGAVAYLSQSSYGKNAEVDFNNDDNYYTGGGSEDSYKDNVGQSTTGNIYGIYDMSGGSREQVMGNYNYTADSSGITPSNINGKYIDIYTAYDNTKYGDAIWETSGASIGIGWYGDLGYMISASSPWFHRGGSNNYDSDSALGLFYFRDYNGGSSSSAISWRVALAVGDNL